jgi:preprotein translocase subunit SecF
MEGWIKLHRKLLKWEWFTTPNMLQLFIYLILSANFEDGKFQGKEIKRGQLITGRIKLSQETGLSVQSVRSCLERLKSTGEITIQTTNKHSTITICNYDEYQINSNDINQQINQLLNQQSTNNQPATNHILRIKEEDKNSRIKKESNSFFSEEELENAKPEEGITLPDPEEKVKEMNDFMKMLMEEQ